MKLAGIEIVGESVSGIGTSISLPELDITLDCGVITPAAMKCQHVLITHGHLDHFHCVDRHAYLRGMSGSPDASIFYVPKYLEGAIHEKFRATARAQCNNNNPQYKVVVVQPGELVEIRKGLCIRPFETIHRIPSQGYVVYDVRQKLLPEFEGLEGAEIGRIRRSGVEVTARVEVPLVAFTGDTQAKVFDTAGAADALRAKVLITECTFIGDFPEQEARKRGHVHIDELAARASVFGNEAVVLAHFSQRHTNAEIQAAMATLPPTLRDKASYIPLPKSVLGL